MEKYEIEKLRSLPIEGVAQRLGLTVKGHKALCCFHNDHRPSLTFKKNKFRCWSCGECGDSISLVERVLGKNFLDACRWLADEHNVILTDERFRVQDNQEELRPFEGARYERFFEHPWLSPEARKFLFEERRLDERVVRWCRLTSWKDRRGVPWLQTPYYSQDGRLVGVQNRNLVKGGLPRFCFPQGAECTIYNLPVLNLLQPGDELWITEGCSDCWAMLSAGHKAIAIPSATLLKKKDIEQLSIVNSCSGKRPCGPSGQLSIGFHMFPDRDAPGERLFLQLKQVLPNLVHHQLPSDCKDFSEYYLKEKGGVRS
ncbi:MAG: hypothetical protein IKQ03_07830 [Prevotella sp.]|nr:hypothetical protein [Prevotella sp.]